MSRPGDPGRRVEFVEGFEAIAVKTVELVQSVPGASSFELKYEAMDRVLAEGEEPRPDEAVQWSASAQLRRRYYPGAPKVTRTIVGSSVVEAGGSHYRGIALACVDLLERLGVNTVVLDDLTGGEGRG